MIFFNKTKKLQKLEEQLACELAGHKAWKQAMHEADRVSPATERDHAMQVASLTYQINRLKKELSQ